MAIIYASSMDHYGPSEGATFGGTWNAFSGWQLDNDIMLGDGWAMLPQFTSSDSSLGGLTRPEGLVTLSTPSFGARRGERALVYAGAQIRFDVATGSFSATFPNSSGATMLAIPGDSKAVRIIHFAFACDHLPAVDMAHGRLLDFHNKFGARIAGLRVTPSGRLALHGADNIRWNRHEITTVPTTLLTSAAPVIEAGTWVSLNIKIEAVGDTWNIDIWAGDIIEDNHVIAGVAVAVPIVSGGAEVDLLGFLPLSISSEGGAAAGVDADGSVRAIRDIVICDDTGTYNNAPLGTVFVSAQDMRSPDDGGGWGTQPRENFSTGILDAVTANTGIAVVSQAALNIGAQDFTLETMARFNTFANEAGEETDIISRWSTDDGNRSFRFYYDGGAGALKFDASTDGTTAVTVKEIPWDVEKWKWYHLAVSRWSDTSGSYLSFFVDGVEIGVPVADANTYHSGGDMGIGAKFDSGTTLDTTTPLDAYLDETRVTIGVGRYTADFTPPSAKFGRSVGEDANFASVVLLLGYEGAVEDESSAGRTLTLDAVSPVTFATPGDAVHAYDVLNHRPGWDDTFFEATNYYAQSILTLTALPTAGETATIGTQTYTFVNSFDTVATDQVLIGTDIAQTLDNFTAAVNGGAGEGVVYGTGTVANTGAVAVTYVSPQLIIRSLVPGESTVATTETLANGSFDGATLSGGTDLPAPSDFQIERLPVDATGVLGVQATARVSKSDGGSIDMRFDLVGASGGVAEGANLNTDLATGWRRQVFEQDPDTSASITPSTVVGGRLRFNRVT